MTEDTIDTTSTSPSPVVISDSTMSEQTISSDKFLKPSSLKPIERLSKRKVNSLTDKDAEHSELKKKKKKLPKPKSKKQNIGESEDAAESVDSGCIADIAGDVTDWPQVEAAVLEERNYVLSLLSWLPDFQWVVPDLKNPKPSSEKSSEDESSNPRKSRATKNKDPVGTRGKLREFLNEADEIDSLREKYTEMLAELRRGRRNKNKNKKEGKLQRKLKNLTKRTKKNANRQRKLEQAEIYEKKHQVMEKKKKKAIMQTKIFNEKGKLVFSKFDFSSDGTEGGTKKTKNLELKVAQALKDREMRKQLEKEGDFKGSSQLKDVEAWSSALQRAEGVKVRDDLGMLQKSLKKKEHRKKMSKKRWDERTAALEKKMSDKQQKRQENLKARREAKLEKKGKKLKNKGHIVPGF